MHWKKKTWDKNFFSDNVEWISEKLWKMILADIKTDVNNKKKRPGRCIFFWVPSKLETECKQGVYFPIQLDYVH